MLGEVKLNTQNSHFRPHIGCLENTNVDRRHEKTLNNIMSVCDAHKEQIDIHGLSRSREMLGGGIKNTHTQNNHFGPHNELLVDTKAVKQQVNA